MIETIKRLLSSRKAVAAVSAGLGVALVQYLGLDPHQADTVSQAIVILASVYVGATGYEDAGRAQAEASKPPAP